MKHGSRECPTKLELASEVIIRLHERFEKEGIVIPFPMRTLDIRPGHVALLRDLAGISASGESKQVEKDA